MFYIVIAINFEIFDLQPFINGEIVDVYDT